MSRKELLLAVILTFITVCAWVIFEVIHASSQTKTPPQLEELLQPINPTLDLKGIQQR